MRKAGNRSNAPVVFFDPEVNNDFVHGRMDVNMTNTTKASGRWA
jgi:hypothetical protein